MLHIQKADRLPVQPTALIHPLRPRHIRRPIRPPPFPALFTAPSFTAPARRLLLLHQRRAAVPPLLLLSSVLLYGLLYAVCVRVFVHFLNNTGMLDKKKARTRKRAAGPAVRKKKTARERAATASASAFRTEREKGGIERNKKKNPPASRGLLPNPSAAPPPPPPRRRRRALMAKSRPPKRILESYTVKGSDKVIKREPPSLPLLIRISRGVLGFPVSRGIGGGGLDFRALGLVGCSFRGGLTPPEMVGSIGPFRSPCFGLGMVFWRLCFCRGYFVCLVLCSLRRTRCLIVV